MKNLFIFILLLTNIFASYEIIENDKLFKVLLKNKDFKDIYINLKDELMHQSYTIIHEMNLSKTTNIVAKVLNKKEILKNGKNILFCKRSLTLKMIEENIDNISYCPLSISTYEKKDTIYIMYKKYPFFEQNNKIAKKINNNLKKLILDSLE